jgi:hypothetical protein
MVASAGVEWGADVRAYFSAQPCADPYRKLPPFPGPENVPPGAHVAFLERPQEDATITRMENGRRIVYREYSVTSVRPVPADRTSFSKISLAKDGQCSI